MGWEQKFLKITTNIKKKSIRQEWKSEDGRGLMDFVLKMDTATQVQTLIEAVCISYSAKSFGKGENPTIPTPALGK